MLTCSFPALLLEAHFQYYDLKTNILIVTGLLIRANSSSQYSSVTYFAMHSSHEVQHKNNHVEWEKGGGEQCKNGTCLQLLMHRLCHRSIEMSQEAAEMSQEAAEMSEETRHSGSRQTADSEVAAAFAEELPAAMKQQQSGSMSPSRLDRYNSLTKGESADGVRHGR